jgi:hypothetical protein
MVRRIARFGFWVAAFVLAGNGAQAAPPDLSGHWKLNAARSNYGSFPAPQSITRKITQQGGRLSMTSVQKGAQGEVTSELVYSTDGKPVTNKVQGGEAKGSAQWIGDKLMIESSREVQGVTLTIDSHVTLPNGEFDIKQVFEK